MMGGNVLGRVMVTGSGATSLNFFFVFAYQREPYTKVDVQISISLFPVYTYIHTYIHTYNIYACTDKVAFQLLSIALYGCSQTLC